MVGFCVVFWLVVGDDVDYVLCDMIGGFVVDRVCVCMMFVV